MMCDKSVTHRQQSTHVIIECRCLAWHKCSAIFYCSRTLYPDECFCRLRHIAQFPLYKHIIFYSIIHGIEFVCDLDRLLIFSPFFYLVNARLRKCKWFSYIFEWVSSHHYANFKQTLQSIFLLCSWEILSFGIPFPIAMHLYS